MTKHQAGTEYTGVRDPKIKSDTPITKKLKPAEKARLERAEKEKT